MENKNFKIIVFYFNENPLLNILFSFIIKSIQQKRYRRLNNFVWEILNTLSLKEKKLVQLYPFNWIYNAKIYSMHKIIYFLKKKELYF